MTSINLRRILAKSRDKKLSPANSAHLDAIRGLAALAVLVMHSRHLLLIDWNQLQHRNFLLRIAYSLSVLGHPAVIVFFILSGFLIGPSALRSIHADQWSSSKYFLRRFFRLEVVLIPALLLCLGWDMAGIHWFGLGGVYGGHATYYPVGYDIHKRISVPIFFGNAAFLQTLRVPILGSDSPLWSLANEFWYYMLFPCAALALISNKRIAARIGYGIAGILIAWFIGKDMLLYFPIWVIGTLVFYIPEPKLSGIGRRVMLAISAGLFLVSLILAKSYWTNGLISDYFVSTCFALFLYWLLNQAVRVSKFYSKISHGMASSSYTLYVVHTPFLVFISVWIGRRWVPTPLHVTLAILILCMAWIYAYLIHWMFEARTDTIRSWAERKLGM